MRSPGLVGTGFCLVQSPGLLNYRALHGVTELQRLVLEAAEGQRTCVGPKAVPLRGKGQSGGANCACPGRGAFASGSPVAACL